MRWTATLQSNFASIAAAVEKGQRVYDNLIKSLAFEGKEPNIMKRTPRDPGALVLSGFVVMRT